MPTASSYDRLAADWSALLSLRNIPVENLLDPLERVSGLMQILYILERAQDVIGDDVQVGDEGSSRIVLGEPGADRLLGKGHLIAKLDTDDKIYLQVPFIGDDDVEVLANAVIETWLEEHRQAAE